MDKKNSEDQAQARIDQQIGGKIKPQKPSFPAVKEIYVDGISGVMGRGGVFKLDCYRVDGLVDDGKKELRRISHRLVLPSSSMSELIQIVRSVVNSSAKAKKIMEEQKKTTPIQPEKNSEEMTPSN